VSAQWLNSRGLQERIQVTGALLLETPAHLGAGDSDGPLDMPLILDPLEGRALLPGTSLAGALRNHLAQIDGRLADRLFGRVGDDESVGSWLIVDDALGSHPEVELRDGVEINPKTRTAEDKKKFDIELLEAGTEFPLSLELLVPENSPVDLIRASATALHGLETGAIRLGTRKRRGYGRCRVTRWNVRRYDLTTPKGVIAYLESDPTGEAAGDRICSLLGVAPLDEQPAPTLSFDGTFLIDGPLLIRSGSGDPDTPDFLHLHSRRAGKSAPVPVLSGTSLAGALRSRALRIVKTLGKDPQIVPALFGRGPEDQGRKRPPKASRLWTEETEIRDPLLRVQTRVKIDRLTGGSFPSALFSEQPVFPQSTTRVHISFRVHEAKDKDVGLVLLLLKDLWTGDLPLGGESSIGRGRLAGERAELLYNGARWVLADAGSGKIEVDGDREKLEAFVRAFAEEVANAADN
jgi:CRISPR/Cas system CSM-associated protein Csm3 (group 7 of RAMP superfamily)